jgi:hypothetical protein
MDVPPDPWHDELMARLSRILVGAVAVVLVALPVAGAASAVTTDSAQMMPMGENGCCF